MTCGGIFDVDGKKERLTEVRRELEDPKVWDDSARAQELGRERSKLERVVDTHDSLDAGLRDGGDMLELIAEEEDAAAAEAVTDDLQGRDGNEA